MKHRFFRTTLLVGTMTIATAAFAQSTSMPAQPDPAVGGQASTKTPAGVPNPTLKPDGSQPASRAAVREEARAHNRNNTDNSVSKGEATTTVNGQPNAIPQPTGYMSRDQVSQDGRKTKPQFGDRIEKPEVPTNPGAASGQVGTPK